MLFILKYLPQIRFFNNDLPVKSIPFFFLSYQTWGIYFVSNIFYSKVGAWIHVDFLHYISLIIFFNCKRGLPIPNRV